MSPGPRILRVVLLNRTNPSTVIVWRPVPDEAHLTVTDKGSESLGYRKRSLEALNVTKQTLLTLLCHLRSMFARYLSHFTPCISSPFACRTGFAALPRFEVALWGVSISATKHVKVVMLLQGSGVVRVLTFSPYRLTFHLYFSAI